VRGTNRFLPPDIAVQWCRPVEDGLSRPQFGARGRRYRYVLLESAVRPALESGPLRLGLPAAGRRGDARGGRHLLGEHDFSAFRAAQCQAQFTGQDAARRWTSPGAATYWRFDFDANAFLHHMVRNIMGCLVGGGQRHARPPGWMRDGARSQRSREAAAPTFAAAGLVLPRVRTTMRATAIPAPDAASLRLAAPDRPSPAGSPCTAPASRSAA
jgi:tRNA pseudouridine38-40 synthase